jgi:phage-related tail fiber protein
LNFIRTSLTVSVALALIACAKSDESRTDTTSLTTSSSTETSQQTEPASTAPTPQAPTPATDWVVTERGIGNLRAGMTVAEARGVYPSFKVPSSGDSAACTYATMDGLPAGVGVMVEGGKIVRAEVRRGNVATSTGARIGDSEEKIKSLYPSQVTVSPHKYTDGHYLTVVPASKADSAFRIIFETDGRKVLRYHAGVRPQVEYVEGCS